MANTFLNWVFGERQPTGSGRLVMLALADRANECGVCWPSMADIARRAALTRRTTERVVRRLIDAGELVILRRGGGRRRTNTYAVRAGRTDAELTKLTDGETPSRAPGYSGQHRTLNPGGGAAKPRRPRHETPAPLTGEPTGTLKENRQTGCGGVSLGAVTAVDPQAVEYERLIAERGADVARQRGALTPRALTATDTVGTVTGRSRPAKTRPRRRIPDAEQQRTYSLLRKVPELADADARDLARIAPTDTFERALAAMNGQTVRNPGGWLRRAVTEGWAAEDA
ncbi:MAG: helix-turn-helix domain-containing protein [Planctomycetes bacterium]|nr:helix-turn-helix domain-containing protein [Planctomycetota bacterium]